MKILFVSSYLPYPLLSGGHIRLYNLLKHLSKEYEVTLICEKRLYQTEQDVSEVAKICHALITVPRKKQWSIANMVKTATSSYPFLMVGHTNHHMQQHLYKLLAKKTYQLIHVETFYVMQNLPQTKLPIILAEQNIEYLVYQRFLQTLPSLFQPLLSVDIFKMKYWEKRFWKKATRIIAVSKKEQAIMNKKSVSIVPNGVDTNVFTPKDIQTIKEKKTITVLYIGNFLWIQNKDAVSWLLSDIWPKLTTLFTRRFPNKTLKLWIVGKHISTSLKEKYSAKSIIFDDNNQLPTAEIFKNADVLFAPIRVAGGTSYKMLEAMASGVPVVTTPLGIEGISAVENKDVILGDSEDELIEAFLQLLQDQNLYEAIAKNARALVESMYDWKYITRKLEAVYQSVV